MGDERSQDLSLLNRHCSQMSARRHPRTVATTFLALQAAGNHAEKTQHAMEVESRLEDSAHRIGQPWLEGPIRNGDAYAVVQPGSPRARADPRIL